MTPRSARKAAVAFILVLMAIDSLGIGLIAPIVPELVRALSGRDASGASLGTGALVATFAVAQLICSPLLGSLSDRFGRRPVILLSVAGMGANYLLLTWAPSLGWLFVGRALAGATAANASTATAYLADISTPAERARRFGLIGATFSFGFVIGPALGGVLGTYNIRLPFAVAATLACCNALYGLFVLPESLPRERRQPFNWRGANPLGALHLLGSDRVLTRLAAAWSCFWFALGTLQTVLVLSTGLRFGWTTRENGLAFALVGLMGAVVQAVLVRRIVERLGERRTAMLGFAINAAAYAILAAATQSWMMYLGIVLFAFGNIANPSVRALLSIRAGPERQGRVMGALSSVEGLTAIVSPVVASVLFRAFAGPSALLDFAGMPFLAASLVYLLAIAAVRGVRSPPPPPGVPALAGRPPE